MWNVVVMVKQSRVMMYIMNGTQDDGPSADILDHYHWYQFVGLCLAPATEDGAGDAAAVVDAPTSRAGVDVVHVPVGAPTRRHDVLQHLTLPTRKFATR
jgi:hypothetical protein